MDRKNVNIVLSIVLGGAILFTGYKMYEKYEMRKSLEIVNDMIGKGYKGEDGLQPKIVNEDNYKEEKEKRDELIKNKEEKNEKENKVQTQKNNSIYKVGITEREIENLKEEYEGDVGKVTSSYGSSFREYGRPLYSGDETEDLYNANRFFENMDTILNNVWGSLETVLNENTYKSLQKRQVQWIKERDKIASQKGKQGTSAYIDEQGVQTYDRVRYLINNYLD